MTLLTVFHFEKKVDDAFLRTLLFRQHRNRHARPDMFGFSFRQGQRVLDRPSVCDLSIPETALSTLINSVVLRHHAEGLPVPRRNTRQASQRTRRMTRMELSYAQNLEDYHLSLAANHL